MAEEFFDDLETRNQDQRGEDMARDLPQQIAHAKANAKGYAEMLADIEADQVTDRAALAKLPVMRKANMVVGDDGEMPIKRFIARPFDEIEHVFSHRADL